MLVISCLLLFSLLRRVLITLIHPSIPRPPNLRPHIPLRIPLFLTKLLILINPNPHLLPLPLQPQKLLQIILILRPQHPPPLHQRPPLPLQQILRPLDLRLDLIILVIPFSLSHRTTNVALTARIVTVRLRRRRKKSERVVGVDGTEDATVFDYFSGGEVYDVVLVERTGVALCELVPRVEDAHRRLVPGFLEIDPTDLLGFIPLVSRRRCRS